MNHWISPDNNDPAKAKSKWGYAAFVYSTLVIYIPFFGGTLTDPVYSL